MLLVYCFTLGCSNNYFFKVKSGSICSFNTTLAGPPPSGHESFHLEGFHVDSVPQICVKLSQTGRLFHLLAELVDYI